MLSIMNVPSSVKLLVFTVFHHCQTDILHFPVSWKCSILWHLLFFFYFEAVKKNEKQITVNQLHKAYIYVYMIEFYFSDSLPMCHWPYVDEKTKRFFVALIFIKFAGIHSIAMRNWLIFTHCVILNIWTLYTHFSVERCCCTLWIANGMFLSFKKNVFYICVSQSCVDKWVSDK